MDDTPTPAPENQPVQTVQEQLMTRNTGFLYAPPKAEDYIFGSTSKIEYKVVLESGDWTKYLPTDERQSGKFMDSMACVTFSALNSVETQVNYYLMEGLLPATVVNELTQLGYIDANGKFNGSDRFTAKMSGTTMSGNYLNVVAESIRTQGIAPESLWGWNPDTFTWEEFYAGIPDSVRAAALRFLDFFDVAYEWVPATEQDMLKHLKQAPIQVATEVCAGWNQGDVTPVPKCSGQPIQHATLIYQDDGSKRYDFDHYPPFRKYLAEDYEIPYMMKILITPKGNPSMIRLLLDKTGTGRLEIGQGATGFNIGIQSEKFFEMVKAAGETVIHAEPTTPSTYTLADNGFILNVHDPKTSGVEQPAAAAPASEEAK